MSPKTLKTLAITFGTLLVLTSLLWWSPWQSGGKISHDLALNDISYEAATQVAWKQNDVEMKLAKENGVWRINGYDTDDAHIKSFFESVQKLEVISLASRSNAAAADFEVSDDKGRLLAFTQGSITKELVLGKQGSSFDTFYIKQKGSTNVYLAKGNLKSLTEQALLWWRDTAITKLDAALINAIEITEKGATTILTKTKDGKWELLRNGKKTELEVTKAQTFTSTLSSLQASDFATSQEETIFKNTKQRTSIVARDQNNATLAQLTLVSTKDAWIVQAQNKSTLFKVPSSAVEKIIKL